MNRVIVHINELGPVKNQTIELAPVMLFTGASSLGKSYVNFLAYYVFNVLSEQRLDKFLADRFPKGKSEKDPFMFTLTVVELIQWMKWDVAAFFRYLYHYEEFVCDVDFELAGAGNIMTFEYRNRSVGAEDVYNYETFLDGDALITMTMDKNWERAVSSSFRMLLCQKILGQNVKRTILLPPGRASLLTGDFTSQRGSSRLGMYDMFLRDNDWINSRRLWSINGSNRVNKTLVEQVNELIKGRLVAEKERLFLVTEEEGKPIPLDAAASSIRELTPLLMWILGDGIAEQSVCLEEPEAHLHPEMQTGVADLLTACIQDGAVMQITTHSDYFMQRMNQLIKYGIIREKDEKAYAALCRKTGHQPERYLDRSLLKTYYFSREGGNTVIRPLEIDENGIPMSTFFHVVETLSAEDDVLNEELEKAKYHA